MVARKTPGGQSHDQQQDAILADLSARMAGAEIEIRSLRRDVGDVRADVKELLDRTARRDGEASSIRLFWGGVVALPGWVLAVLQFLRGQN